MTDEREIYELDFIMMATTSQRASMWDVAEFVFPLAIFEDTSQAVLLIPIVAARNVLENFDAMWQKIKRECAEVNIPYHPDSDIDANIYSWNVYIAWKDNSDIAFGEMMVLEKYAKRLWDRYHHIAKPMFSDDTE